VSQLLQAEDFPKILQNFLDIFSFSAIKFQPIFHLIGWLLVYRAFVTTMVVFVILESVGIITLNAFAKHKAVFVIANVLKVHALWATQFRTQDVSIC
jgi:hypothetical protein